jgi:hypothetical protein
MTADSRARSAPCPARSRSLIATRSSASVLTRRRPASCRWAATRGRADLDQLPVGGQHPGAGQGLVIVPGGLHADPDQLDRSTAGSCLDPLDQQPHPGHGHRKCERAGQQLTGEVADQRHGGTLADIDWDRHQLRRVEATDRLGELLGWAPWTCTMSPPPPRGVRENWHFPLCTSGGGPRSPASISAPGALAAAGAERLG